MSIMFAPNTNNTFKHTQTQTTIQKYKRTRYSPTANTSPMLRTFIKGQRRIIITMDVYLDGTGGLHSRLTTITWSSPRTHTAMQRTRCSSVIHTSQHVMVVDYIQQRLAQNHHRHGCAFARRRKIKFPPNSNNTFKSKHTHTQHYNARAVCP